MLRFKLKQGAYFHYDRMLTSKKKIFYKKVLNALLHFESEVNIDPGFTSGEVHDVIYAIVYDRPDLFWFGGAYTLYSHGSTNERIGFEYVYTKSEAFNIVKRILNSRFFREVEDLMTRSSTEFDKALALYEYIIQNTEYDNAAAASGSEHYKYAFGLEGVILKGSAVCAGYAKTFQYFANRHNIWCTYVRGEGIKENHGWNMIRLFKDYYHLDCTWGDPVFTNPDAKDPDFISYDYFCFTTSELKKRGYPVCEFSLPPCTATRCNYYRYFGYLQENFSLQEVARIIAESKKAGKKSAFIKYADESAFVVASDELFKQSKVFDALKMAGITKSDVNYSCHNKLNLIEITL